MVILSFQSERKLSMATHNNPVSVQDVTGVKCP